MAIQKIDGALLKEMFSSGAALLLKNRESVDALNVFPVPDGDTGSNMSQTIASAIKEMGAKPHTDVGDVADAVARGALKGARGNSGVILSQILRGIAKGLSGKHEIDCETWIAAIRSGAVTAYKAVMKPKEGTILTVIRVISEELEKKGASCADLTELFRLLLDEGDAILKKTPDMLPVLKQAGVVDSGGMGLMVIFRGMYAALTGESMEAGTEEGTVSEALPGEFTDDHGDLSVDEIEFGYCTEFIVSHPNPGMKDSDVTRLRSRLERIGDCVLVISDMSVVKVHVHTNEPGQALQYALELGELDAIKIDNMFEEAREREEKRAAAAAAEEAAKQKEFGIVAVALGDGLSEILKSLAIDEVVDGGQTMNPSIDDLAQAADRSHAKNVFILPNNTNIILAAQQAAELTDRNVIVLPTKSVPMGISAALAFSPDMSVEENTAAMSEAAENVHTGSLTFAVRDTNYEGREIHQGDIMGMIDNKLSELGNDIAEVAMAVTEKLVNEESAIITIYYGSDVSEEDAQALCDAITEKYDELDVDMQYGGQPLYYYLIAVE